MKIVIEKSIKKLTLLEDNGETSVFPISIGAETGHKQIEGDNKTPEGEYEVLVKNPKSEFHLSLGLSYPNKIDALNGLDRGLISKEEYNEICERLDSGRGTLWNTKLGGQIYIHGNLENSTGSRGCICLNKEDIEMLFEKVRIGTKVKIEP